MDNKEQILDCDSNQNVINLLAQKHGEIVFSGYFDSEILFLVNVSSGVSMRYLSLKLKFKLSENSIQMPSASAITFCKLHLSFASLV